MPVSPVRMPMADAPPILLCEDLDDIAVVTLNRPEARNSLSLAMLTALGETFAAIAADRKCHHPGHAVSGGISNVKEALACRARCLFRAAL